MNSKPLLFGDKLITDIEIYCCDDCVILLLLYVTLFTNRALTYRINGFG